MWRCVVVVVFVIIGVIVIIIIIVVIIIVIIVIVIIIVIIIIAIRSNGVVVVVVVFVITWWLIGCSFLSISNLILDTNRSIAPLVALRSVLRTAYFGGLAGFFLLLYPLTSVDY